MPNIKPCCKRYPQVNRLTNQYFIGIGSVETIFRLTFSNYIVSPHPQGHQERWSWTPCWNFYSTTMILPYSWQIMKTLIRTVNSRNFLIIIDTGILETDLKFKVYNDQNLPSLNIFWNEANSCKNYNLIIFPLNSTLETPPGNN
jgi:hypothetical protein